jgi:hypothetical protein
MPDARSSSSFTSAERLSSNTTRKQQSDPGGSPGDVKTTIKGGGEDRKGINPSSEREAARIASTLHYLPETVDRRKVLNFFNIIDVQRVQRNYIRERHTGTLAWFGQNPEFQAWLSEPRSMLWAHGTRMSTNSGYL